MHSVHRMQRISKKININPPVVLPLRTSKSCFYSIAYRFDEKESITDGVVLTDPYTIDIRHATAWRMETESEGKLRGTHMD